MVKNFNFVLVFLIFFVSLESKAYPSSSSKMTILELINGRAQKGLLKSKVPVSFDDINCSRGLKMCSLAMRLMVGQEEIISIHKSLCNVEPVDTLFDILDAKTGDLTDFFVVKVNECF